MQKIIEFLFFLVTLSFLFSCDREETEIGLDFDSSNKIDILSINDIKSYTFLEDSIVTATFGNVLGCSRDAFFGETHADIYTQISLPGSTGMNLSSLILDSVRLDLGLSGLYPAAVSNYPKEIYLQVYQLSNQLSENDSIYHYSTDSVMHNTTPLFEGRVSISMDSSGSKIPSISVRLDDSFMIDALKGQNFTNNSSFISTTKGLCLKTNLSQSQGDGAMMYLNLSDSSLTGVKLYYRENADDDSSKVQKFTIGSKSYKFSRYRHNYRGSALSVFTNNKKDSIEANPNLYIQNLSGVAAKIVIQNLKEWKEEHPKAIINNAVLVLPVIDNNTNNEPIPQLLCEAFTSTGRRTVILDLPSSSSSYLNIFGGKYDSNKKEYRMRITRHIQNIANGLFEDYGLYVYGYNRRSTANDCVIDGSKISLELHYSE